MNTYWFKPKRYGYGATPSSWEGWVCIVVFIVCIISAYYILPISPFWYFVTIFLSVIVLIIISKQKTQGSWKWRWG